MKAKHLLSALIIVTVVLLVVIIARHTVEKPLADVVESLPDNVDVALTSLHYSHNEDGVRQWVLDADEAEYQRQAGLARLNNITLEFYNVSSFSRVRLTAGQGTFDQNLNKIELWDNVFVQTDQDDQLTLDRLVYDQGLRQLNSDGPVTYKSSRLSLSGNGLQLNIADGVLLIKERVKATLKPQAGN